VPPRRRVVVLPSEERTSRTTGYGPAVGSLGALFGQRLFLTRGLIAFFLFASFGSLWSGLSLPLADPPWQLNESQIGLFGIAGLAGALGAARAGRWADAGRAAPVTGIALSLLVLSWAAIAQLPWSLWLLVVGIVVLDLAVQAVHVSNQHLLTAAHPDRTSSVIGGYMVFYSLGSALGAAATTAVFSAHGWAGSSLLGAGFAACASAVWAVGRRHHGAERAVRTSSGKPCLGCRNGPLRDRRPDPAAPGRQRRRGESEAPDRRSEPHPLPGAVTAPRGCAAR
jgi:predicted MFS family arabinose efflux permease